MSGVAPALNLDNRRRAKSAALIILALGPPIAWQLIMSGTLLGHFTELGASHPFRPQFYFAWAAGTVLSYVVGTVPSLISAALVYAHVARDGNNGYGRTAVIAAAGGAFGGVEVALECFREKCERFSRKKHDQTKSSGTPPTQGISNLLRFMAVASLPLQSRPR